MNELWAILSSRDVVIFALGLVSASIAGLIAYLRERLLDSRRAKREDMRAKAEREWNERREALAALRDREAQFTEHLRRFVRIYDTWREREVVFCQNEMGNFYIPEEEKFSELGAPNRSNSSWARDCALEDALADLLITGPTASQRNAAKAMRVRLQNYRTAAFLAEFSCLREQSAPGQPKRPLSREDSSSFRGEARSELAALTDLASFLIARPDEEDVAQDAEQAAPDFTPAPLAPNLVVDRGSKYPIPSDL